MSNKGAKVPSDNAVPRWALAIIKGLLDMLGNILLDVVLLHSLLRDLDGLALQLFAHVCGLDLGCIWLATAPIECALGLASQPPAGCG